MVFCLILWVSWISILSKCLYVSAGNEFPYRPGYSTTNLLKDDDAHDSLSFDDVNKGHSKSPTSVLYFSFDGQYTQPGKLPEIQSITNVENILNGISRKWDSNLFEPITFPLKPGNPVVDLTVTKPAVVKPQGSPLDTFSGMKPAPISLVGTGSYDPLANLKPSHTSTSWSMASPGLLSKQPANPGSEETHLSPFQYRYVSNGSSQKRIGSSKIPSLFEGASGRHTVDASSPGSGKPQPLPSMFKPSPNSVSFDTGSHFGQRNDLIGQDTVNSVLQRKLPMKNPFDSDQSGQSNFIDAGPPTDHASTMWETPFDGTENQVSNEWMIPFFKMVDNWNFDFPQIDFKPQKSVSSSKGSKVYQPVNSMRPQKRIINSKNAYKRGRFVLSKTTYTPDHQMQQIKDATVLRSSKRPTQSVKL